MLTVPHAEGKGHYPYTHHRNGNCLLTRFVDLDFDITCYTFNDGEKASHTRDKNAEKKDRAKDAGENISKLCKNCRKNDKSYFKSRIGCNEMVEGNAAFCTHKTDATKNGKTGDKRDRKVSNSNLEH